MTENCKKKIVPIYNKELKKLTQRIWLLKKYMRQINKKYWII